MALDAYGYGICRSRAGSSILHLPTISQGHHHSLITTSHPCNVLQRHSMACGFALAYTNNVTHGLPLHIADASPPPVHAQACMSSIASQTCWLHTHKHGAQRLTPAFTRTPPGLPHMLCSPAPTGFQVTITQREPAGMLSVHPSSQLAHRCQCLALSLAKASKPRTANISLHRIAPRPQPKASLPAPRPHQTAGCQLSHSQSGRVLRGPTLRA